MQTKSVRPSFLGAQGREVASCRRVRFPLLLLLACPSHSLVEVLEQRRVLQHQRRRVQILARWHRRHILLHLGGATDAALKDLLALRGATQPGARNRVTR